jgi:hypothetical protein
MLEGTCPSRAGAVLLIGMALCASTGPALAAGPTLVVSVDEPFEVDGQRFPAATLSLRAVHEFTPTTTLNEVWVGDRCLGLMRAVRTDDPRLEASRNAVLFGRNVGGDLVLRGFAYRLPGWPERYRFELLRPAGRPEMPATLSAGATGEAAPLVIAAQRLD